MSHRAASAAMSDLQDAGLSLHSRDAVASTSRTHLIADPSAREWSAAEVEILRSEYPKGGTARVLRKLKHRSKSSIYSKANALNLKVRDISPTAAASFSVEEIAQGLGVAEKTVTSWCKTRGLVARSKGGSWRVTRAALRRWLAEHPRVIQLAKVDQAWFMALALAS